MWRYSRVRNTAECWENVDKAVYMQGTQLAVIAQLLGFAAGKNLSTQGVCSPTALCCNT